jgi:hypothetical protein
MRGAVDRVRVCAMADDESEVSKLIRRAKSEFERIEREDPEQAKRIRQKMRERFPGALRKMLEDMKGLPPGAERDEASGFFASIGLDLGTADLNRMSDEQIRRFLDAVKGGIGRN